MLAPTHALLKEINHTIRDGLNNEGVLTGKPINHDRLVNQHMTPMEKSQAQYYSPGDVLVFHQDVVNYLINKGAHFTVTGIGDDNRLQVESPTGEMRMIKPQANIRYTYDAYEAERIPLQQGDHIRFTRNAHNPAIANGDEAVISKITQSKITMTGRDGEEMVMARDDDALKHIDHGYAKTVHSAQGLTTDHVIAVLNSGHGTLTDQ